MNKMMRNLYLKDLGTDALRAEIEQMEWRYSRLAERAEGLEMQLRYTRSMAVYWWREWIKAKKHEEAPR